MTARKNGIGTPNFSRVIALPDPATYDEAREFLAQTLSQETFWLLADVVRAQTIVLLGLHMTRGDQS